MNKINQLDAARKAYIDLTNATACNLQDSISCSLASGSVIITDQACKHDICLTFVQMEKLTAWWLEMTKETA